MNVESNLHQIFMLICFQVSNIGKKQDSKLKISKLAYLTDETMALCFRSWEGATIARSLSLGQWYDLPNPGDNQEMSSNIFLGENEMAALFFDNGSVSQAAAELSMQSATPTNLSRQADSHLVIINDCVEAKPIDLSCLVPAVTALKACIVGGWKPTNVPQVNRRALN